MYLFERKFSSVSLWTPRPPPNAVLTPAPHKKLDWGGAPWVLFSTSIKNNEVEKSGNYVLGCTLVYTI